MKVSTVNLSPKLDGIGPAHGTIDRGEMTPGALTELLTAFQHIDPALNLEHDPQVLVRTSDAWHLIRTERGQLCLYNARDTSQPGAPMPLADLLAAIQGSPAAASTTDLPQSEPEIVRAPPTRSKLASALAVVLLVGGIGLNAWGVYQLLPQEGARPPVTYAPLKDDERTTLYLRKLAGTYATGNGPGHRIIHLTREGAISFDVLVQNSAGEIRIARGPAQTCGFGQRPNGAICLTTSASGPVIIRADGSLFYSGDTYRRISTLAE
ncbi:MAG: hypothetical protein ACOZE5_07665 [Verrucomicrobiota bacterium]